MITVIDKLRNIAHAEDKYSIAIQHCFASACLKLSNFIEWVDTCTKMISHGCTCPKTPEVSIDVIIEAAKPLLQECISLLIFETLIFLSEIILQYWQ